MSQPSIGKLRWQHVLAVLGGREVDATMEPELALKISGGVAAERFLKKVGNTAMRALHKL